jgi:hypothetical protein
MRSVPPSLARLPFVMALKPRRGTWAYGPDARTPVDAERALAWGGPDDPGDWHPVARTFRDGHAETWWAAEWRMPSVPDSGDHLHNARDARLGWEEVVTGGSGDL